MGVRGGKPLEGRRGRGEAGGPRQRPRVVMALSSRPAFRLVHNVARCGGCMAHRRAFRQGRVLLSTLQSRERADQSITVWFGLILIRPAKCGTPRG
ncbi:hypothetical protein SXIM_24790 [Streptomyces xiamenensis]|uniref:Uncharacterized protein n=1 Tax=Streptomyces xiamenensis TaxID=408015 RepID=A0A0F7FVH9_9ACTN|nr:hypothetical protein SXIM_24790 [Streptomyces xiamenensis]